MSKWLISTLDYTECHHCHSFLSKYHDDWTVIHDIQKNQIYTNQNKIKAIQQISLIEQRNIDTVRLLLRKIYVRFGDVFTREKLNQILEKRKLAQLSEENYQFGIYFNVRKHDDIVILLSTLHEISPFSNEMKTAIVNYLAPDIEESKKLMLKKITFSKFTKITSLFNLCVDKINEQDLYSENSGCDLIPKISF